jgi:hypothetical protein
MRGDIMNGFFEFLESKAIKDIKNLTHFVYSFVEDPSIFFDLTATERDGVEKELDEALAVFMYKKTKDTHTSLLERCRTLLRD